MNPRSLLLAATVLLNTFGCTESKTPLYKDPEASIEKRVDDLLGRMTLKEKVAQMQNITFNNPHNLGGVFDGISYGCTHDMQLTAKECAEKYRLLQQYMIDSTRLGIPMLIACEGVQGILQNECTIFPHSLGQGSTFNPQLIKQMTGLAADEARVIGINQILSPVLDIARELRWGRVEETYGEDPFLIAEMGTAFIEGFQQHNIACMPKHFLAHGSPTGGLNCANVSGGERELRSVYLYPFEKVIKATKPLSVMSCYSAYDGVASVGSPYYMTRILRDELGFDGYLYSDWGSVEHLHRFHFAAESFAEAARMAVVAGLDLNVDDTFKHLDSLVTAGRLDEKYIDRAVGRILTVKFKLGLFENPFGDYNILDSTVNSQAHVDIARQLAQESAVLLQNNNAILPLDLKKYRSIAVVGPNSDQTVFGDYSWPRADSDYGVTLLDGLRNAVGDGVTINAAMGCDWWSDDRSGIAQAVSAAQRSDIVVVAIGTRSTYLARDPKNVTSGEGFDLSSLDLPGVQLDLLKELKKTGKPLVVVFISGKPLALPWVQENADALLVQWYAGEQQGNAAADILLGKVNPSGRLNVSFPRSTGNTPCYYNYLPTDRGHFGKGGSPEKPEGHYIFEQPYAMWSFGYGLSYTTFEYRNFEVNQDSFSPKDTISVSVNVANTGAMDGQEVVQLYVRDKISSVSTPIRQLKAFNKCSVASGHSAAITLRVPVSELALYNEAMERVVEPGEFELQLGQSSDSIVFRKTIIVR